MRPLGELSGQFRATEARLGRSPGIESGLLDASCIITEEERGPRAEPSLGRSRHRLNGETYCKSLNLFQDHASQCSSQIAPNHPPTIKSTEARILPRQRSPSTGGPLL
jgi:hypothetical protein